MATTIQLFAADQVSGLYVQLDLFPGEPIKMTFACADINDPTEIVSEFSQSFRLPHTSINGQFFKDALSVNGSLFNLSIPINAYINVDNAVLSIGQIHLSNIFTNYENNTIEYEVVFVGLTSNFSTAVGGKFLGGLLADGALNFGPQYIAPTFSYTYNIFNSGATAFYYNWSDCVGATVQGELLSGQFIEFCSSSTPGITYVNYGVTYSIIIEDGNCCGEPSSNIGYTGYNNINLNSTYSLVNQIISWEAYSGNGATGLGLSGGQNSIPGDILYPLIEWGYDYDENNNPIQSTISLVGSNNFTNPNTPLNFTQLKPVIRAKCIWDEIFIEAGFQYNSTFLNSDYFKRLYVASESLARSELSLQNQTEDFLWYKSWNQSGSGLYFDSITYNVSWMYGPSFPYNNEVYNAESWRISNPTGVGDPNNYVQNSVFSVPTSGTYVMNFSTHGQWLAQVPDNNNPYDIYVALCYLPIYGRNATGGGYPNYPSATFPIVQNQWYDLYTVPYTGNEPYNCTRMHQTAGLDWTITVGLTVGDRVLLVICTDRYDGSRPVNYACNLLNEYSSLNSIWWTINYPTNSFNINTLMPDDKKQIDYIKGINDKFKLVWTPAGDAYNPNVFDIEPFATWITGGTTLDWTSKLDMSKDLTQSAALFTQKRILLTVDKTESDFDNYRWQQSYGRVYGWQQIDSGYKLLTDTQNVETIFAPTPLDTIYGGLTGIYTWLMPHLAKIDIGVQGSSDKILPIRNQLRLLFYNGLFTNPPTLWNVIDTVAGVTESFSSYPLVSNFDTWNDIYIYEDAVLPAGVNSPGNQQAMDLNWSANNQPIFNTIPNTSNIAYYLNNVITPSSVFTQYWQTWYNLMFDPTTRVMTAYFKLTRDDILNLQFNNKIWVNDSYWLVTKIYDWEISEVDVVKVDLLQYNDVVPYQPNPIIPNPGGTGSFTGCTCNGYKITNTDANSALVDYISCYDGNSHVFNTPGTDNETILCGCTLPTSSYDMVSIITQSGMTCGIGATCICSQYNVLNLNGDYIGINYTDCSGGGVGTISLPNNQYTTLCSCSYPTGFNYTGVYILYQGNECFVF